MIVDFKGLKICCPKCNRVMKYEKRVRPGVGLFVAKCCGRKYTGAIARSLEDWNAAKQAGINIEPEV